MPSLVYADDATVVPVTRSRLFCVEVNGILNIETEKESEGKWIAEVMEVSGAMAYGAYGATRNDAIQNALAIARAERQRTGEEKP